ncbi:MAG: mechanosensitive ion channel family protein [Synechococcales bacterium]|nr:mechanosensitive ion channel family protein [Synechococcales bacterium]
MPNTMATFPSQLTDLPQEIIRFLAPILPNLLWAGVILLLTPWVVRLARHLSDRLLKRVETTLQKFLLQMVGIVIWIVGGVAALNIIGIETTTLVAVVGAAGVAIGLALQNSLSHIAAGIMLVSFRPFEVGDAIEGSGISGTVDSIGLFSTTILTGDNVRIIVPNNNLISGVVKNQTVMGTRRVDIRVSIGDRPLQPTMQQLLALVTPHPNVLTHPKPICQVQAIAYHNTVIILRPWCQAADYDIVRSEVLLMVKEYLDRSASASPGLLLADSPPLQDS